MLTGDVLFRVPGRNSSLGLGEGLLFELRYTRFHEIYQRTTDALTISFARRFRFRQVSALCH